MKNNDYTTEKLLRDSHLALPTRLDDEDDEGEKEQKDKPGLHVAAADLLKKERTILISEVVTRSTAVACLENTAKMRSRKPCSMSMRVEWTVTTVTLRFTASERTTQRSS